MQLIKHLIKSDKCEKCIKMNKKKLNCYFGSFGWKCPESQAGQIPKTVLTRI